MGKEWMILFSPLVLSVCGLLKRYTASKISLLLHFKFERLFRVLNDNKTVRQIRCGPPMDVNITNVSAEH